MRGLLILLVFLSCPVISIAVEESTRPNFVVVLCDDLGWGDLENYGHPTIKTPRLMQMAAEGIVFSDFYSAAPVCSPSRVGLLTGRNPNRAGVYDWIPSASPDEPLKSSRSLVELRESEFTIAKMLKSVGYATVMSGKWHCNAMFNSEKQAQPGDHGFDHWFATQNNAAPSHENPKNFVRNGEEVGLIEGYSCEIVADEFIDWLGSHHESGSDAPFFAYIAYHEPHEPV
ncbi:MAG: sulfatase-like hydrolase/transferase, partial [Verrucomicrobiota bacterium]